MSRTRKPREDETGPESVDVAADPQLLGRTEAGETLIEILLALIVLGITSVAILMAFATSISGSLVHRNLVTADTVLRSAAAAVTTQIQQQTAAAFLSCGAAGLVGPLTFPTGYTLPTGYTVILSSVTYWNGTSFVPGCIGDAPQLVTVTVTASGVSTSLGAVVDDPLARPVPAAGTATQLAFTTQPGNGIAGSPLTTQPVVSVEDMYGNPVYTDLSAVKLTITPGSGSSGVSLSSNCQGTESYGVISFTGCQTNTAGTSYTITATDGTLATALSATFSVIAGPVSQVGFTTSPGNTSAGTAFVTPPAVAAQDAYGNTVTTDTSSVTLGITAGTGSSGASVSNCSGTQALGVTTFPGCNITKVGTAYSFTASDGSLTPATSGTFNVTAGAVSQLVVTTAPGTGIAGAALAPPPVITVQDAYGNTVTTDTSTVTLAITTGTGATGATVASCLRSETTGISTFTGCTITKTGTYTLTASDGTLTPAVTGAFSVTPAAPSKYAIISTAISGAAGAGTTLGPITVQEQDAYANPTTVAETVSLASSSTGTPKFSVTSGGTAVTAVSIPAGSSSIPVYYGDTEAGTPTITASGLSTSGTQSESITAGAAAKLVMTVQPSASSTAGTSFSTQPVVTVEDANGNPVTNDASTVTIAITSGTGSSGATVSGCSGGEISGVVTFTGCNVTRTGTSYTLTASDGSLTHATSNAFNIVPGAATQLAFTASPGATSGTVFAIQPIVAVEDTYGNVVTTSAASVALAISSGTGTLRCTTNPINPVSSGVAAFAGCRITLGTPGAFTLKATSSNLTTATTGSFTVSS